MQSVHSSPHTAPQNSITRMMLALLLALIPGILVYIYFFGWGVIVNMTLAVFSWLTYIHDEWLIFRCPRVQVIPQRLGINPVDILAGEAFAKI